jgi:twitching motility protein PilT
MVASLQELLTAMVERGASDLHLSCATQPQIRLNGNLEPLTQFGALAPADTQRLVYSVLNDAQRRRFEEGRDLDLSFGVDGLARFRCNVYRQRGVICAAMRLIPYRVRSFEDLQLPAVVEQLSNLYKGLVLVTGPTGSGKSTTLAAMIDKINSERHAHIVTVEDPIEFVHQHKKSLVHQREICADIPSFAAALTIAETGHLTFATLHTNSCAQTINRIIDAFPTAQQSQVRAQLSLVLEGVLSQTLVPTADGRGRAMAMEIMVPTPAIRNLIRDEKIHQIYSMLQSGGRFGMKTMNQSLADLVRAGKIAKHEALSRASSPDEVATLLAGASVIVMPTGNGYDRAVAGAGR